MGFSLLYLCHRQPRQTARFSRFPEPKNLNIYCHVSHGFSRRQPERNLSPPRNTGGVRQLGRIGRNRRKTGRYSVRRRRLVATVPTPSVPYGTRTGRCGIVGLVGYRQGWNRPGYSGRFFCFLQPEGRTGRGRGRTGVPFLPRLKVTPWRGSTKARAVERGGRVSEKGTCFISGQCLNVTFRYNLLTCKGLCLYFAAFQHPTNHAI